MTLVVGTVLNQRYRVIGILGQGGMGSVHHAVDENLGVDVAVKENLFTTEEYARQFHREAVILATLRHPNLTRVTDHFVIEGQGQYLVMDYIEGEDLRERMDRVGTLSEEETVIIGAAVCDALRYLESVNPPVVHRDIKPGNVKIMPNGQIYLVDFGLAKLIQPNQATTTGARAMTPGYSPPEQYGTARTDHRSDIFSLGATLYAALTGAIPEDALAQAMDQVKLTPVRKQNPKISRRMAAVIEKSLAVRPDDRFQTADEFKQALLSVRSSVPRRKTGEFVVTPPPAEVINPNIFPDTPAEAGAPPQSDARMANQLPEKPRRSFLGRFVRALAVVTILLGLLAVAANYYYPALTAQALSALLASSEALPVVFPNASPTPSVLASVVAANASESTAEPSLTPTPNPTRTQAPPSTPTPLLATEAVVVAPAEPSPTPTTTPLGGGGGDIAFASDRSGTTQIWLMGIDGTNLQQLTDIPEGACQPSWSPDGVRLVFISPCRGNEALYRGSGLFLINADGADLTPLPNVPGGDFDPAWSPDGGKIAFASVRNTGRPRLYLIDLADNSTEVISFPYSYDRQPAWSADGNLLAFVTTQKGPVQIWTMNPDGSDQQVFSRSADAINTYPSWSLDGNLIMFNQIDRPGSIPSVVVATYTDGDYSEYRYEMGPIPVKEPRYSPDGLWLVFESWPKGRAHDIFIMTASGAGRAQLTDDIFNDFDAAWRPVVAQPE